MQTKANEGEVLCPRAAALTVAAVGGLLVAAPSPLAALRTLQDVVAGTASGGPVAAAGPDVAVVALVALAAWCLAGWLAVAAALTAGSRLPGPTGRVSGVLVRRVAPRTVRRALELALGMAVATGAGGAGPASASYAGSGPAPVPAAATAPVTTSPPLDWPTTAPVPAGRDVVVVPGDTLWDLAERSLGAGAPAAQIAQTWPAWWSANRDAIGADPHLLHPGTRLVPPPTASSGG